MRHFVTTGRATAQADALWQFYIGVSPFVGSGKNSLYAMYKWMEAGEMQKAHTIQKGENKND